MAEELKDGAVIVHLHYAGENWLAREILKEAGDAVVLEPDEARRAVLDAPDADFASELVDRLLTSGPGIALDAGQWARIERILGRTADPVEADALVEALS